MNARTTTTAIGAILTFLGAAALFYPQLVMQYVLGFAIDDGFSANFVHGEVRAVYGGVFTVLGIATLLAAFNPAAHRNRLMLIGMALLGALGGRALGAIIDGTPGLFGWLTAAAELIGGGALVAVAQTARPPAVAKPMIPDIEPISPSSP